MLYTWKTVCSFRFRVKLGVEIKFLICFPILQWKSPSAGSRQGNFEKGEFHSRGAILIWNFCCRPFFFALSDHNITDSSRTFLVETLLLTREHTVKIDIVNLVEMMEEIKAARTTIGHLTTERNELDKKSSAYAEIHTNITNDIVARTTLLNTLISQQGNSFPDLLFQSQFLTDNIHPPILLLRPQSYLRHWMPFEKSFRTYRRIR